tara:strand:- start:187 stop:444 length:258 start_codon:yes stop_codon:yes gene_type:complete
MSNKKSYMDVDNILSEGIYQKIVDKIADKITKSNMKKSKEVKKIIDDLNDDIKKGWEEFNKIAKEADPNYKPYKPKKYKLSDLVK